MEILSPEEFQKIKTKDLFEKLGASENGLTAEEALKRLENLGANTIAEKKIHPLIKFLGYFWGPIPWMIEAAAILSLIVRHWTDLVIISIMLVFNAVVGFWQEYQASNALAALKDKLALTARAKRDGKWQSLSARDLVPGDVIRLRPGDIIPADARLFQGDYIRIDESALTGESLASDKKMGDTAYSGAVAKQGEMVALVCGTGANTFFAKTAKLVEKAGAVSHFQKAVLAIGDYLIYLSLALAAVLVLTQLFRGDDFISVFQFILILVVAAIPVAMPAVLSVTMAMGALVLSRDKAIVSRLQSIEEIAGVDVLCTDKTGTLTKNQLTLGEPLLIEAEDVQDMILMGALASKRENKDAIDEAILDALEDPDAPERYDQTEFTPFDPVSKHTRARIKGPDGKTFSTAKGAPQVIFDLCELEKKKRENLEKQVSKFASRGYRTLGVARSRDGDVWQLLGILPLFDPPRNDSEDTIRKAEDHGLSVKMVTGDNLAIAREISRQLGMGQDIRLVEDIFDPSADMDHPDSRIGETIEETDGFAQVFPEHKYGIVKALQSRNHLVAMTGDGVNDAPALKQAEVGIAVSGATNAAQAAAALVLTAPGLSVIIRAIEEARKIFERMNSYAIYRITETIRIMFFVVLAMVVFNFYPINTVMIILLALLNDLPIMTIAKDNTLLQKQPVRWDMRRILTIATVIGLVGVIETFGLLVIGRTFLVMDTAQLQSFIYLKLAVAGHLTLLVVRTKSSFLKKPYPAPILLWAIIGTQLVAVAIVGFGFLVAPIPWSYIGLIWAYCLVWVFIEDMVKRHLYNHLEMEGKHHRRFLAGVQKYFH